MVFTLSVSVNAQSAEKVKQQTLDSVMQCNSNAYEIINQDNADNIKKYMTYNGVSYLKKDFVSGLGTTVHECLHGYDDQLGDQLPWDNNSYPVAYFIDKDLVVSFSGKRLFKTEKLHANFFPKEVKNMFRYDTYIYDRGPADVSSNQWGIYGLLEEFNAYYHDMKSQIEYYNCNFAGKQNEIMFGNEVNAYFEFNTFMAYYLLYAKKYQKEDYQIMMANVELRRAYSLMEINWQNLLTEIFTEKDLGLRFADVSVDAELYNADLQKVMKEFMLPKEELEKHKTFVARRTANMNKVYKNLKWAGSDEIFSLLYPEALGGDEEMINSSMEFSEEISFREPGYYYVTVLITDDAEKIKEYFMQGVFTGYANAGMFVDEHAFLHLFLDKFKTKNEALVLMSQAKKDFSKVKVE
jgi:hypothetical protein